jgi:putative membrane protein
LEEKPTTTMKRHASTFGLLIVALMMVFASCSPKKAETDSKEIAEEQNDDKFDSSKIEKDVEWATEIADASLLEVKLGELAQTKASSPQVKELGKMMVTDHSKANEELNTLAGQKNISLPNLLSDKSQKKFDDLATKTGADFDKEYSSAMVEGHKEVLSKFKKEAEDGKDADLRSWAEGKLPVLQHHLSMSEQTEDAVKKIAKNK